MKIGFYAGSFDPFTEGHLHVAKTSAQLFDLVIVAIGIHPKKSRRYNKDDMKLAIEKVLKREQISNVIVICYDGLTSDIALEYKAMFLIRGLRNGMDYDYEENISQINEEISELDTVYIRAGQMGFVSSSMVMELLRTGKNVSKYVPKEVLDIL